MRSEGQNLVRFLFEEALQLPGEEQEAYLLRACDDESVRAEVLRLLAELRALPEGFLEGAIDPPTAQLPIGKFIGPYQIVELLGEGGMGQVFRATQEHPIRRTVALKLISFGLNTRDVLARFDAERRALEILDHPHIARVLDAGSTDTGRPYFVMELVPGLPITQFCDDKRLSIAERLRLFIQVCDAIAHAHTKGIIHRDVKPGNVLAFAQDGVATAKVIDFGIAKALMGERLGDLSVHTSLGRAIGTYEYMSPEQAEGAADADTRADVYSLGVLLYELLTGSRPFERSSLQYAAEIELRRIIRDEPPPTPSVRLRSNTKRAPTIAANRQMRLDQLARDLRNELEWIPLKALRKEPNRRYQSPSALASDVQRYLMGQPLLAGPESAWYKFRKFAKRNRTPLALGLMLAISIIGILVGSLALGHSRNLRAEAYAASQTAELRLAQGRIAEGDLYLATGNWTDSDRVFRESMESLQLIHKATARAELGLFDLWRHARPTVAKYPESCDSQSPLKWMPDDQQIIVAGRGCVQLIDAKTGRLIKAFGPLQYPVNALSVTPDGRFVFVACVQGHDQVLGELLRLDLVTRQIQKLDIGNMIGTRLAISADGTRVAIACIRGELLIFDVAKDIPVAQIGLGNGMLFGVAFLGDSDHLAAVDAAGIVSICAADSSTRSWKVVRRFATPISPREMIATPDRKSIIVCGWNFQANRFDVATGRLLNTYGGHRDAVWSVSATAEGRLFSASDDGDIREYSLESGESIATMSDIGSNTRFVATSHDESMIASSGAGAVYLWGARQDSPGCVLPTEGLRWQSAEFTKNGKLIMVVSGDSPPLLIDVRTGRLVNRLAAKPVFAEWRLLPDGDRCVGLESEGQDGSLHIWNIWTGKSVVNILPNQRFTWMAVTCDGKIVALGNGLGQMIWVELTTGAVIQQAACQPGRMTPSFSPNGTFLALAPVNGGLWVYDRSNLNSPRNIDVNGQPVIPSFDRNGHLHINANSISASNFPVYDPTTGAVISQMASNSSQVDVDDPLDISTLTVTDLNSRGLRIDRGGTNDPMHGFTAIDGRRLMLAAQRMPLIAVHDSAYLPTSSSRLEIWNLFACREYDSRRKSAGKTPLDQARWLAINHLDRLAIEQFEKAHLQGWNDSDEELAACYWLVGRNADAAGEYHRLNASTSDLELKKYYSLCANAAEHPPLPLPLKLLGDEILGGLKNSFLNKADSAAPLPQSGR